MNTEQASSIIDEIHLIETVFKGKLPPNPSLAA